MSKTDVQSADKAAKTNPTGRKLVFISKATPGDDDFVLWLAPRLEGAGYEVFADILNLEGGSRWRREVTERLQNDAVKMLLCCRDSSLAREGVQEEIGIATDLASELEDPKFIIPLRLERYKKLFGIGGLQWVDFTRGWAQGLDRLLETLRRQKIPQSSDRQINANWELYRRRYAVSIKQEPERLTSNWLRIVSVPEAINYLEPSGAVARFALEQACNNSKFPIELHGTGIYSFGSESEINQELISIGRFKTVRQIECISFVKNGCDELATARQEASNLVHSAFRQAWIQYCRAKKLTEYQYSNAIGFHISDQQAKIGQKVVWGRQGEKRSSMLRNAARGHVWNFGVNAIPAFWPFPHFKLKSRVLFAVLAGEEAGSIIADQHRQHRLRRTVCKGWRNKQWHGRLLAYLELLSGDSSFIDLPLSPTAKIRLDASPMLFSSPVSTLLPNKMEADGEEQDDSTLGRPVLEDDDAAA